MKLDPRNFIVREKFIGTLRPRWGGSYEKMSAFLEDCRKAGLSDAHLRALERIVVEDQAQTHQSEHDYAAAERDYRRAIELEALADFTSAAEQGDASSQNEIGTLYMSGIPGVLQRDRNKGIEWFRKSAAQGYALGRQNLETALRP